MRPFSRSPKRTASPQPPLTEPLVTLATYSTPFEAEIVKGRLEDEGVTVVLADAEIVTSDWMYSNAVGGVKLRVPEAEAERARALLAEPTDDEDYEAPTPAEDIARRALTSSALGLSFPPLHLYTAYLIAKYVGLPNEGKSDRTRRQIWWAVLFMIPWLAVFAAVIVSARLA